MAVFMWSDIKINYGGRYNHCDLRRKKYKCWKCGKCFKSQKAQNDHERQCSYVTNK